MAVFGLLALAIFVPLGLIGHTSTGPYATFFVILLVLFFIIWICFAIFFAVVSYFMVAVMYIRRFRAMEAFRDVTQLVVHNVASFVLFCLFSIVLFLAIAIIGTIVSCVTCCIAALPYIGTVILLPLFVCMRAFGFCFLRQFGPDYDAWGNITPPNPPAIPEALPA